MKILIIKHGALGDMISAMGAFSALRKAFPRASMTLLTSSAYKGLAKKTGFFNEIWSDDRSKNPFVLGALIKRLKEEKFDWVFDLQNSQRTAWYFRFLKFIGQEPQWSGVAPGCSHPQHRKDRQQLHAFVRFADQLKIAGVPLSNPEKLFPDMSWLPDETATFSLPERFIVLVPGSSKKGAHKRWKAQGYGAVAQWIHAQNITPVVVGSEEDTDVIAPILALCPQAINLKSKTSLIELAGIQKKALATLGNDTGAIHLSAAVGCPTLVLWSKAYPVEKLAPQGDHVRVLFRADLQTLHPQEVISALQNFLKERPRGEG